jgi:hypothetical protein
MTHKEHLQHTNGNGPTCQNGRMGGSIRGEHFTSKYSEFAAYPVERRCTRCSNSKLFAFLERQAAKASTDDWVPEDQDAWKVADDKLMRAYRERKAA